MYVADNQFLDFLKSICSAQGGIVFQRFTSLICKMYFKISMRTNPLTGVYSGYYRLIESYRNSQDNVHQRTVLNAGYLDELTTDQLNLIQKILTAKVNDPSKDLFESSYTQDPVVIHYVEEFYQRMVKEKRIDVPVDKVKKNTKSGKDIQAIDLNSIRNKDVREIGGEWLCYQAMNQLHIGEFLKKQGWNDEDIQLAQTHIISRAVYPASELETARWIRENSSVCEITGYDIKKITKDQLYRISRKLYAAQEVLEQHLSIRTNELFDIEDRILLYDLTNTYFEGRKTASSLAKFGRSKEKRDDAKLVVLALVVNRYGFIKYSSVLEGNMSDARSLEGMIDKLRIKTSASASKALVVIDAGIATDDNLEMIKAKGYDYLCVSRSNLMRYTIDAGATMVSVMDNKKQKIDLCPVKSDRNTDFYLKVESHAKEIKERSMND